jgi:hypothetical protein
MVTQNGILPTPLWKMLEMVPIEAVKEFVYSDRIVGRVRYISAFVDDACHLILGM